MMETPTAGTLGAFAAEARRPDAEPRLDRAALLIAAGEYPRLDIDRAVAELDSIASGLPAGAPPREMAAAICRRLFAELSFRGNTEDYYDPRNSYLNDVLERRTGIPISLAAVFLEVGRRIGLDAAGVSFPRHFLVKYRDGEREWLVDPFHGGEEVEAERFRAHIAAQGAAPAHAADYYLAAVTRRQILTRMLTNLKLIYLQRADYARALRIQEYLVALSPWSFPDIRDRGVLRGRTADIGGALHDLETYLAHGDPDEDIASVRSLVARLRAGLPLNQ